MDNKRLVLFMVIGVFLIVAWPTFIRSIAHIGGYTMPTPATMPANPDATVAQAEPLPPGGVSPTPTTNVASTQLVGGWSIAATAATTVPTTDAVARIGSALRKDSTYALQVAVSDRGAGLDEVLLNDFYLTLREKMPFAFQHPGSGANAEQTRSLAVRGVEVDGVNIDLTGKPWTLVSADRANADGSQRITYELPLTRSGNVDLLLRRIYTLFARGGETWEADGMKYEPKGFEVRVQTVFVNRTDRPMQVALRFNAPSVPPTEAERYADGSYIVGYAHDNVVAPVQHMTDSVRDPKDLLADRKDNTPFWFGSATTYFMAIHRFEPAAGGKTPIDLIKSIDSRTLTPETWGAQRLNEVVVNTKPVSVDAMGETTLGSRIYFGPRKREILTNDFYSLPWVQYDRALVISGGVCGYCTWQWLIDILFIVLKGFHTVTRDWGLAIIGLVFLVRLVLHPISRKAQLNMLTFGKHAPEMAKIKERYKDDQETMNREMMRFYKEHGSTQVMGCLPMFLQMPVWIALWQAMNTTFDLRHEPFFYGLTWIHDLSKPDHLIDFANYGIAPFHLPLLSFVTISGINVLPFVYGLLQFIQFKIQPKPPTMTEEQAQQQKMTQYMILFMMPVLLYASPSGLMIYMITSFVLGITETKLVKKEFEKRTANEARFTVVDENSPAAAGAVKAMVRRKQDATPKKKGLFGMLEEARARAAEMQREIEKNRKKR